jgi:hypothetical protein
MTMPDDTAPPRSAPDDAAPPRLRPRPLVPVIGTLVGAAAGFAFYWFLGCDSG